MIKIEHLKKEYPGATPLQDVNAEIRDGDVISVIGPSGTGKSTLLRCINQMEKPTAGKVWLDDEEITDPACDMNRVRRKMGMVFQSFNLFGHMTVIENIMKPPMELLGKTKQEAYDNGIRLLRLVGLADKALHYPDELSGGQKQWIAIARTLAMDPDIILLDEPTSALDPAMVDEVNAVIKHLASSGMTLLIVTHDMSFARDVSNRVFYMDEGIIYEDGTPEEIFNHPKKPKTIQFIRKLFVIEEDINGRDYDITDLRKRIYELIIQMKSFGRVWNSTILLLDETIHNVLIPMLQDPFHIHVRIECRKNNVLLFFDYSGQAVDTASLIREKAAMALDGTNMDDPLILSAKVISTHAKEITWCRQEGELINRLQIEVK